jgi:uncharacterized protein (TIGR03437 family)
LDEPKAFDFPRLQEEESDQTMTRTIAHYALPLMLCLGAHAATTSTTLTVHATASIGTSISATGTATLSGIGSGTFNATLSIGTSLTAPFTIALSGGNLTGTLTLSPNLLTGSGTGSATITGGTGSYAGATGSFPSLSGTGTTGASGIVLDFTGAGQIITGGTTGGGGGGGGGTTTPTITAVLDAGGYTKNIAEGSIFVVKGSNLSASGFKQYGFPLPTVTTADNVKITFTPASGGTGTDAYLIYLYNQNGVNQLAAVLPSSVAAGNYNVTVTNGSATSAPFAATVVQRKFGMITQDSTGSGLAVVQNYISAAQADVNRFTTGTISGVTISPAHPGQVLIIWGTGLGPITTGDNVGAPFLDQSAAANVQVLIGGVSVKPFFAGRAPGFAGLDQINVTLPPDIPTGCTVSLQVSVNGTASNATFIAIAPDANSSACVLPGFTSQELQNFDNGGTLTVGSFSLTSISESVAGFSGKFDTAGGAFYQFNGFQLSGAAQYRGVGSTDACFVVHTTGSQNQVTTTGGTALDAGPITLTGPAASNITNLGLTETNNLYSATLTNFLGGSSTYSLVAGTYTLKGAGGKDVGAFNSSITMGSPLVIAGGLPATVVRSAGLPLQWTGGNASDLVQIIGFSGTITGTGANASTDSTEFICSTTAGKGSFTVPSSILNQLPAVSAADVQNGKASGFLEVISTVNPSTFTANLVQTGKPIDLGLFLALSGTGGLAAFQ